MLLRMLALCVVLSAVTSKAGADTPTRPRATPQAATRAPLGATLEQARRWRVFTALELVQDPNVRSLPNDRGDRPLVYVPRRGPFRNKAQVTLTVTSEERVTGAEITFVRALLDSRPRALALSTILADFLEDVAPEADRAALGRFVDELRATDTADGGEESEEHALALGRARGHRQIALTETTYRFEMPSPFMQGFEMLDGVRVAVWLRAE